MKRDVVDMQWLTRRLRENLTPDLLHKQYKTQKNKMSGHCYVASEALFHLLGGFHSGLKPMQVKHEGKSHWFLQDKETGDILDITADQFSTPVPYEKGRGRGFLTRNPSKRALKLMGTVHHDPKK